MSISLGKRRQREPIFATLAREYAKAAFLRIVGAIWSGFVVHEASIQDRDGAPSVLALMRSGYLRAHHIFADRDYAGDKLQTRAQD